MKQEIIDRTLSSVFLYSSLFTLSESEESEHPVLCIVDITGKPVFSQVSDPDNFLKTAFLLDEHGEKLVVQDEISITVSVSNSRIFNLEQEQLKRSIHNLQMTFANYVCKKLCILNGLGRLSVADTRKGDKGDFSLIVEKAIKENLLDMKNSNPSLFSHFIHLNKLAIIEQINNL